MVANTEALDRIFGALSDRKRRAILRRLTDGTATVGELARPFDVSRQAISKHLRVLEDAGLVERQADGRMTRCSLEPGPMKEAAEWVERFRTYWEGQLDALARYVEGRPVDESSEEHPQHQERDP